MQLPQNRLNNPEFLFREESYKIRGAIFAVYKEMGAGFLEAVYQECLTKEFILQNIPFNPQSHLNICYKGEMLQQVFVPDFICYDKIIIEIKGIKDLRDEHRAQLLNYMKVTGMKLGLLANFGAQPKVQLERMVRT